MAAAAVVAQADLPGGGVVVGLGVRVRVVAVEEVMVGGRSGREGEVEEGDGVGEISREGGGAGGGVRGGGGGGGL